MRQSGPNRGREFFPRDIRSYRVPHDGEMVIRVEVRFLFVEHTLLTGEDHRLSQSLCVTRLPVGSRITMSQVSNHKVGRLDFDTHEIVNQTGTTSLTVFEIGFESEAMAKGKRQRTLQEAFLTALTEDLSGRVLDFDVAAADEAASISARLRAKGRPVEIRDVMIAGIVAARRGTLATRNTKHFQDTKTRLVNPWEEGE